jgi:hypothetical protein
MKRRQDGTHEPGMRQAGQTDAPAEVSQAELDALIARVDVIEDQLPVYSSQLSLLSAKMAQRTNALVRVGTGVDIVVPDIGPRYMLQAWRMAETAPLGIVLVNNDAEADTASTDSSSVPVTGWNTSGMATICEYADDPGGLYPALADPGPPVRGLNFFAGGLAEITSMKQSFDFTDFFSPFFQMLDEINNGGLTFEVSVWLGGHGTDQDSATLSLVFLDDGGGIVSQEILGPVTQGDRGGETKLMQLTASGTVPPNTRYCDVVLQFTRVEGGPLGENLACADEIVLTWSSATYAKVGTPVLQIVAGDHARSVAKYVDAGTNRLEEHSPDIAPGYWNATVPGGPDNRFAQANVNDDWTADGIAFLGFFERDNAWKRDYLLKAVAGGAADGPIPMMGARVGDTVYAVSARDMGSINRFWNSAETDEDEASPLQPVPLHPDNGLFEVTVTVDDEIQQISEDDLSANTYLFFLCRGATQEAEAPRDYILSMAASGNDGPAGGPCPRSFLGDVVESVIKIDGRSFEHAEDKFETTISTTGQLEQTSADDLRNFSFLILLSRPTATPPTPGTMAPIAVPGVVAGDVVENAFLVDQVSGELVELYPADQWFATPLTGNNAIQQIAGQMSGRAIAFLLKREYPNP